MGQGQEISTTAAESPVISESKHSPWLNILFPALKLPSTNHAVDSEKPQSTLIQAPPAAAASPQHLRQEATITVTSPLPVPPLNILPTTSTTTNKIISTTGEILPAATQPPPVAIAPAKSSLPPYKPLPEIADDLKVYHRAEPAEPGKASLGLEVEFKGGQERMIVPEHNVSEHYPGALASYYWRIWLPEVPKEAIRSTLLTGQPK